MIDNADSNDTVEVEIDEDVYQHLKALADAANMDMCDFIREHLLVVEIPGTTD